MARKNRTQFVINSSQTASTLAATYRALISRIEAGEMTEAAAAGDCGAVGAERRGGHEREGARQ